MSARLSNARPLLGSFVTNGLGMFAAGLMIGAFPWFWFSNGGSATTAGFIAAIFHAGVAFGLFSGGMLIDRLGPRPVLLSTDLASAAAFGVACASFMVTQGNIWPTIGLVAFGLMLGAPGNVAQDSRIPVLARMANMPLGRANGLRDLTSQLGQVIGPITGVLLVELTGLAGVLFLVSVILVTVFLVDFVLFPAFRRPEVETSHGRSNLSGYIARSSGLKAITILATIVISALNAINDLIGPSLALLHKVGATGLSMFFAMLGAGLVIAMLSYTAVGYRYNGHKLLLGGLATAALGLLSISVPSVYGYYAGALVLGLGLGPLWAIVLGSVQRTVPLTLRAGVIGLLGGVVLIVQPLASASVGALVDTVGPFMTILGFGLLVASATLIASKSKGLRILLDVKLQKANEAHARGLGSSENDAEPMRL